MKIVHTADLHLRSKEHISVVEAIVRLAQQERAEVIVIAGDLFDASANGRVLETLLLPIWESFGGDILIIPGNHDFKYLHQRSQLADNVTVAHKLPFSVAEINGVYFVCVPYQEGALQDIDIPHFEPSILVAHGTYQANNAENSYFPIISKDIAGLYQYVALGHYHTWWDKWDRGTLIVNPGAPRQTRKSDKGVRYVSLVDTDTWIMERVALAVSFVEYKTVHLSVVDSEEQIAYKLLSVTKDLLEHPYCHVDLTLQGTVAFSSYSLSELLELWKDLLKREDVDVSRMTWHLEKITQVSPKIIYSSFTRLLVDKISETAKEEVNDLAPFLLERLQQENQRFIE